MSFVTFLKLKEMAVNIDINIYWLVARFPGIAVGYLTHGILASLNSHITSSDSQDHLTNFVSHKNFDVRKMF